MTTFTDTTNDFEGLDILQLLCSGDFTMSEITDFLNKTGKNGIEYKPSITEKFINALELANISLITVNERFRLTDFIQKVFFNKDEIRLLTKISNGFGKFCDIEDSTSVKSFFERLTPVLTRSARRLLNYYIERDNIRNFAARQKRINIRDYENSGYQMIITYCGRHIRCEILEIYKKSSKTYVEIFNIDKRRFATLSTNLINDVELLPYKAKGPMMLASTAFCLTGELKNNYRLRKTEKILDLTEDYLAVLNTGEDDIELYKRLLKYEGSCEVINSGEQRAKFAEFVGTIVAKLRSKPPEC